jgi:adenylate kinase family enzyme
MIIHISGISGAGKTTIGNKLKEKFGDKITVCDTDDLINAFIKWFYGKEKYTKLDSIAYQKYIDNYITKHSKKPLVFVGLNIDITSKLATKLYYNLHADYKYFIKIDDKTILHQRFDRFFTRLLADNMAKKDLTENNDRFLKLTVLNIKDVFSKKVLDHEINKFTSDYKKQNYIFASRESIFISVSGLIKRELT